MTLWDEAVEGETRYIRRAYPRAVARIERETVDRGRDALEGMVQQFAYWSDGIGGYGTGGLSALEEAFSILGWEDPHPFPDGRCSADGCLKQATIGTPVPMPERYRHSCWDHQPARDER